MGIASFSTIGSAKYISFLMQIDSSMYLPFLTGENIDQHNSRTTEWKKTITTKSL